MKVHIESKDDLAIGRVIKALKKYAPAYVEFVDEDNAELIILHIIGRLERTTRRIEKILDSGAQYAIIQYCLKSTQKKSALDWIPVWENAELVWSYLGLPEVTAQDGGTFPSNFYYAPLGVDSTVFKPQHKEKEYFILTSGKGYLSESVREVIIAAEKYGTVAHLGPDIGKSGIDYYTDISDKELVELYNKCKYISGLRRIEGFELPAAEGLLCGARPILYDRPHYKNWYGGLAVFIPETHRDQIVEDLVLVFTKEYEPVTFNEIEEARYRFDWEAIINGFWSRL